MTRAPLTAIALALLIFWAPAQTMEIGVRPETQAQAASLASLGFDLAGHWPHMRVYGDALDLAAVRAAGFEAEVIHADVEAFYRSRLLFFGTRNSITPPFGQGAMGGYYTATELIAGRHAVKGPAAGIRERGPTLARLRRDGTSTGEPRPVPTDALFAAETTSTTSASARASSSAAPSPPPIKRSPLPSKATSASRSSSSLTHL